MFCKAKFIFYFLAFSSFSAASSAVNRVEVFYYDIGRNVRTNLTVSKVRGNPDLKIEFLSRDAIDGFLGWLGYHSMVDFSEIKNFLIPGFTSKESLEREVKVSGGLINILDVRVVIDLYDDSKLISVLISDGFWVYDEDLTKAVKVNSDFESKFEFGGFPL